jgi:protein-L-isoaspartate(D-aspartate) O-methyltransferase
MVRSTIYEWKTLLTRFEIEREELIKLLRKRGITDEAVLAAMGKVERHEFVGPLFQTRAYEDTALPIGCNQTISQPFTVAFMTQALAVKKGDKVLEVGTGSGYQAAVLAEMGCRVYSIERQLELLAKARQMFDKLHASVLAKGGDGTLGWPEFAPYNGIIVTAGGPSVPQPLKDQLAEGGRLVIPVGDKESQTIVVLKRTGTSFMYYKEEGFKFVPLIGRHAWE